MLKPVWQGMVAAAFVLTLGACDAKRAAEPAAPAQPPSGWVSECLGRAMVDVPAPVYFGQAQASFYSNGNGHYYLEPKSRSGPGTLSIGSSRFTESVAIDKPTDFESVSKGADYYFNLDVVRDGGSFNDRAKRAAITTKQPWREPHSFIWRSGSTFDFGIYVPSDRRPRMLHGKLSGEGSAAQAKAVVDALWPRYRPRQPGVIPPPDQAGICTPYGFFADPKDSTERDYQVDLSLRHPAHANLDLGLTLATRNTSDNNQPDAQPVYARIEDVPTPWEAERQQAAIDKANCRPQQGTASRDLFGCMLAGMTTIKRHREVEYLTLATGQRARLMVWEYSSSLANEGDYAVSIETLGEPGSATQPKITVSASAMRQDAEINGVRPAKPPSIDEAVAIVRSIASSIRLRPGAVNSDAPVKDSLAGVR